MGKENGQRWFRMHTDLLNNPKIGRLTDLEFRIWIQCLAIAANEGDNGCLPPLEAVSYLCHKDEESVENALLALIDRGLIDRVNGGRLGFKLKMHDWEKWQYQSDSSTERSRTFRERRRNVAGTSLPHARATESEQNRTEQITERARARESQKNFDQSNEQDLEERSQNVLSFGANSPAARASPSEISKPDSGNGLGGAGWTLERRWTELWELYIGFGDATTNVRKAMAAFADLPPDDRRLCHIALCIYRLLVSKGEKPKFVKWLDRWIADGDWRSYRLEDYPQFAAVVSRRM